MSGSRSTDTAEAFARTCERFIALCMDSAGSDAERLWDLRQVLGELIARHGDLTASGELAYEYLDAPSYDEVRARIGPRFPSLGLYDVALDPLDVGIPDMGAGDAIDDLADIYGELNCGLQLWRQGRTVDAVGHWLHSFGVHWGPHALEALRIVSLTYVKLYGFTRPPRG